MGFPRFGYDKWLCTEAAIGTLSKKSLSRKVVSSLKTKETVSPRQTFLSGGFNSRETIDH